MFDWFADSCLRPDNSEAHKRFGYGPLDPERLLLSDSLKMRITSLCDKYNQALDWGNPTNGLRWNMEQRNAFLEEARNISRLIQDELGSGYLIVVEVQKRYPDLSLEQQKMIANDMSNYAMTNGKLNMHIKNRKMNHQVVSDLALETIKEVASQVGKGDVKGAVTTTSEYVKTCLLHNKNTKSCKPKMDKVA